MEIALARDGLALALDGWSGALIAPQEGRRLAWPALRPIFQSWSRPPGGPADEPYVCTAFVGTGAAAASALLLLWEAGYAPAPLDLRLDAAGLAERLRLLRPRRVLASRSRAELVAAAARLAELPAEAISFVDDDPATWSGALRLPGRAATASDPGLVIFTSGTTGQPKAVLLTRANLLAVADAVADAQRLTAHDRVLNALSLAHVNAPVIALLATVRAGGDLVLLRRFDPGDFWRLADEHGATWANLAPPLIATLARRPGAAAGRAPAGLRFARTASAPLPPATARAFEEAFGVPVVESYGISEAASQVTINDVPPGPRRPGWVGWPRGTDLRLLGDDGREVPLGQPGQLFVRGPGVMAGYFGDPVATAACLKGGWLATGDLGVRDESGALRLVGRRSEIINRGGEKIAPRAVEEALLGHPDVAECAVVGVPDPTYGQEIAAFIVPSEGARVSERDVRAFARTVLPLHMRPRIVAALDELPRTPAGKVARRELAATAGG